MASSVFGPVRNKVFASVFRKPFDNPYGNLPWYQQGYAATATDGSTVYPTWIFDGLNQRFAKSASPNGNVSQVTFSGLLENFTRASSATYFDASGTLQTAGTNEPRFTYDPATLQPLGLLVEESRTNFLLNSGTPATQTVTLATGTYTLWVVGSGSCTPVAGTAVGTGFAPVTSDTPDTFTLTTAGTVVFTVSGSLTRFQCENDAFPTSYIPTSGTTVTRAQDTPVTNAIGNFVAATEGTIIVAFTPQKITQTMPIVSLGTSAANRITLASSTASGFTKLRAQVLDAGNVRLAADSTGASNMVVGQKSVAVFTFKAGEYSWGFVNDTLNTGSITGGLPTLTGGSFVMGANGHGASRAYSGLMPTVIFYSKVLTEAECQRVMRTLI